MSDPRSTPPYGATPWGGPDPRQGAQPDPGYGAQPQPEQVGSRAHPQDPYAAPQYPAQYAGPYAGQYTGQDTGPQPAQLPEAYAGQYAGPDTGQHHVPVDEAYPPARRRLPRKPLPEPPASLAVGAVVAACCLLFVELAELAIMLVVGDRGATVSATGISLRFDPNSDTVTALFGLAAYVATCAWLRAGRTFALAANPAARFAHGPSWTWFGWWVPVASLWIPYQVVRDIRGAVVPDGERRVALGVWWSFWLLAGLRLVAPSTGGLEVMVRSVAALALTVALVHWIRIVREVTRAQERAAGLG